MISIFKFELTGSLFIESDFCEFFIDANGNYMPTTLIKDPRGMGTLSRKLLFVKREEFNTLPDYIKQPLALASVSN